MHIINIRNNNKNIEMYERQQRINRKDTDENEIEQPIKTVNGQIHIKRYKKIKKVGEGSYSKCYLVQTVNSESTYVVKIIPKIKLQTLVKQKLIYQIKIQKILTHKNVVHLDHWFEDKKNQYIFMEYCPNGNLQSLMNQLQGGFTQNDIRFYGSQIVEGLQYIHSKNILHRDLKLSNFYLDAENNIKIGDFGFACQLAHPNQLKRQSCGTPNYIAPEAISGFGYSFTSDVWGFGVALYRMKYKLCPFEGTNIFNTLENVKLCKYSFLKHVKISKQLKDLIQKIFVLNYDDRLTLQQIINHSFFQKVDKSKISKVGKVQRGFSFKRLFSIGKETETKKQETEKSKQKEKEKEKERGRGKQKEKSPERPKRSNSCDTLKEIKEIIKKKTTGTQPDKNQIFNTQQYTNSNSLILSSFPSNSSFRQQKTIITIVEPSIISRKLEDSKINMGKPNKVNEFMKQQIGISLKQQIKKSKIISETYQFKSGGTTMKVPGNIDVNVTFKSNKSNLLNLRGNYHLPYKIQIQKDIFVIHYKSYLKQIIQNNEVYLLYLNKQNIYNKKGEEVSKVGLSKMLKYIIDNNIYIQNISEQENQQFHQFGFYTSNFMAEIKKLPKNQIILKDAIILQYSTTSTLYLVKINTQQSFYLETQKFSIMYNQKYQVIEGVVLQRIYAGFLKNNIKK